ncbi:hypothetical protein CC80DRAFT_234233 [Byssothecium circinans]|uniref:LicD/FKTN/FKRP nucleotidyltransferase domain-containing protein n=1 Tax=Byssothecium circinans TaxID=147558 RepID=A0A6A5U8L2_9PLEO|nr:hypothetical protein CC80DRAFT_234233 [Byssothecium circinans]
MRFSTYVAAVAWAFLLGSTVATPIRREKREDVGAEEKKLTPEEQQRLKYFHEPGDGDVMGHYDARYFRNIVSDEERTETQLHMIRAYLGWFRDHNLDTWIAHGTLLGWWWNGKRLPWDWDLDTQVSGSTLAYMGERYNQTRYKYNPGDGKPEREYLLDINPMIIERERGDGMNVIDARWIDVSNGLFVDITGLSETHPDTNPGEWVCKNYHRYATSDLYPMRETMFEGVVAKVPYSYDKILVQEYEEKALVVTEFQGHVWSPQQKLWEKTPWQIEQDRKEAEKRKQEEEGRRQEEEQRRQDDIVRKMEEEELKKKAAQEEELNNIMMGA